MAVANADDGFDDVYSFDRTFTTGGGGANPRTAAPTSRAGIYDPSYSTPDLPEPSYAQPTAAQPAASGNDTIANAYQQYLGRTGSQDEYNAHSGGGTWGASDPRIQEQVGYIKNSPEGQTYSAVSNFQQQVQALQST